MNSTEQKEDLIKYILENESAFGILVTISFYGSQNLQILSENLKRKPNSLIYHLQKLTEKNLIEIDVEKSNLPGKYYKLTQDGKRIIDLEITEYFESVQNKINEYLGKKDKNLDSIPQLSQLFTGIISFVKILSSLWITNLQPDQISIKDGKFVKNDEHIGPSQMMIQMVNVGIEEDDKKILEIIRRYSEELDEAVREIEQKYHKTSPEEKLNDSLFGNAKKFRFMYIFSALFNRDL